MHIVVSESMVFFNYMEVKQGEKKKKKQAEVGEEFNTLHPWISTFSLAMENTSCVLPRLAKFISTEDQYPTPIDGFS